MSDAIYYSCMSELPFYKESNSKLGVHTMLQ